MDPALPNLIAPTHTNIWIKNSDAILKTYSVNEVETPVVTEGKSKTNSCYITSFCTQYIAYVQEEVLKSNKYGKSQKAIARYATPVFLTLAKIAKMQKISWINNSLVSTPLYQIQWNDLDIKKLAQEVAKDYPKHTIAYRGVEPMTNPKLYSNLKKAGFIPLIGRQVYIFDSNTSTYKKKRSYQMDKKLAERQEKYYWTLLDLDSQVELDRVFELYEKLYLEKHSVYNPIYTPEFVKHGIRNFKLRFEVLKDKKNDTIVAVQGIHETESVINTSFIGYDQTLPKKDGVYRLMNYEIMRQAIEKGKILNMSSGAGDFKSKRGGVPSFEYQMIYPDNLSPYRKWIWKSIAKLLDTTAKQQMQNLKV